MANQDNIALNDLGVPGASRIPYPVPHSENNDAPSRISRPSPAGGVWNANLGRARKPDLPKRKCDHLERRLWPLAVDDARMTDTLRRDRKVLKYFLQNYEEIKAIPGAELFEKSIWCITRENTEESSAWVHMGRRGSLDSANFSECLGILRETLRSGGEGCLRFCLVSAATPKNILYSFQDEVNGRSRLNRKYHVSRDAILHVLKQEWQLNDESWIDADVPEISWPSKTVKLPSKAMYLRTFSLQNPETLVFKWQFVVPRYINDLYEYIWQRQTEPPGFEFAKFSVHTMAEGSKNVFILLGSTVKFDLGDESLRVFKMYKAFRNREWPCSTRSPYSIETEIVASIYALYSCLIEDTEEFLTAIPGRLSVLTSAGRRSPSGSKLHYLTYLDDCRQLSSAGLTHGLSLLSEISKEMKDNPQVDKGLAEWDNQIKVDLEFLLEELDLAKAQIEDLRSMLRDKLELRQISRTYILTFLAAIYLPLSFMASLFGMNLGNPLWDGSNSQSSSTITNVTSNATNLSNTAENAFAFSQNQTDALISTISSSGPYLWTFKSYWYITVPVIFATIILPLVIGSIFRTTLRFSYRCRAYWRFLAMALVSISIISEIFFQDSPALFIFGVLLGLPIVSFFINALVRKRHRVLWTSVAVIYLSSFLTSVIVPARRLVLVYISPVVFFFFLFREGIELYLTRRSWKIRHQSSRSEPDSEIADQSLETATESEAVEAEAETRRPPRQRTLIAADSQMVTRAMSV